MVKLVFPLGDIEPEPIESHPDRLGIVRCTVLERNVAAPLELDAYPIRSDFIVTVHVC